jgi:putative oxidoreductase
MNTTARITRFVLGVLLLWAAVGKLADLHAFYVSILAYQLPLPGVLPKSAAVILPWIELLCGLLLVQQSKWDTAALALAGGLFAIFTLATAQAWLRGLDISCGCFDLGLIGLSPIALLDSTGFAVLRAMVLFSLSAWTLRWEIRRCAQTHS